MVCSIACWGGSVGSRGGGGGGDEGAYPPPPPPALWLEPLGSGSDFTPFLQHLTLSSLNVGFGGESNGGIYHSVYDTVNWYTKFSDGDFVYGANLHVDEFVLQRKITDHVFCNVRGHFG